jgi:hypothetical protein
MQKASLHITVSPEVKAELEKRKDFLSRRMGKKISIDTVLRIGFGWRGL